MKLFKRTRLSLALFCIALSVFLLFPNETARDWEQIKTDGTLYVAVSPNDIDCCTQNDTLTCFHQELAKAFAEAEGVAVSFVTEEDMDESLKKLRRGRCDIIAQSIAVTAEKKENMLFSEPVLFNKQVVVVRKEHCPNDVTELARKTVYACNGSPAVIRLENLSEDIGDSIFIVESDLGEEELIEKVRSEEIDYFVCDSRTANLYADSLLSCETVVGFSQSESWAFRKKSPHLKELFDHFMHTFKTTHEYQDLYNKYYK
ncbi:MAG: transporter substrate-binding domain-containing protein [Bacteroidales bacterium]|nr:transporter substrate-binding domain-containing protein [Bacteroidales bacterium]